MLIERRGEHHVLQRGSALGGADGVRSHHLEPALLEHALHDLGYAPSECLVVGDKACDIELGQRLGIRTALVRTGYGRGTEQDGLCAPDVVVDGLHELAAQEVCR